MKIKQTIALALAGCLIFGSTVMAAPLTKEVNDVLVDTAITDTIKVNQTGVMTAKKIQEKNDIVEIDITIPVIEGLKDVNYQKELNFLITQKAEAAKAELEKDAQEYAEVAKENNWNIWPYQLFIDYELKANNKKALSFTITNYTYTGGANGMTTVDYYNVDKNLHKEINLADLFRADADYKAVINEEIRSQIETRVKEDEEYFFEDDMGFKTIANNQDFYLDDNNLVIAFGKYEIAPGAMGIPEFAINLDNLKGNVNVINNSKIVINGTEIKTILNQDKQVMIHLRSLAE
ncbi:MAG TPA: DUF3298 and DUF4163 domain-containing protein, partial [Syntrophomonadaceae bacterium]|nr:DUF3298 and DUF4163 domain-containing protein [Syntrophomonadaceae bacterium]